MQLTFCSCRDNLALLSMFSTLIYYTLGKEYSVFAPLIWTKIRTFSHSMYYHSLFQSLLHPLLKVFEKPLHFFIKSTLDLFLINADLQFKFHMNIKISYLFECIIKTTLHGKIRRTRKSTFEFYQPLAFHLWVGTRVSGWYRMQYKFCHALFSIWQHKRLVMLISLNDLTFLNICIRNN